MSLRRVIILLDRSSSMAGAPVGQAGAFVEWSLLSALKGNRHIYGNVLVSLIAFDTSAEWIVKDSDIDSFVFPNAHELAAFGGATLGAATDLLAEEISRVGDSESDLIVLISDGHFLDDVVDDAQRSAGGHAEREDVLERNLCAAGRFEAVGGTHIGVGRHAIDLLPERIEARDVVTRRRLHAEINGIAGVDGDIDHGMHQLG